MTRLPFAWLGLGLAIPLAMAQPANPTQRGPTRLQREIVDTRHKIDLERNELAHAFRMVDLGATPGIVTTREDALPASTEMRVRIWRIEDGTLKEHPASRDLPALPSGPLPDALELGDGRLLLVTSRHLIFTDGQTFESVPAPWPPGDRSASLTRSSGRTWILAPEGTLYVLGERDRLERFLPPETPACRAFVLRGSQEVLWWLDEHGQLHRESAAAPSRTPADILTVRLPHTDEDPVVAFDATVRTACAMTQSGRLMVVRDGELAYDSAGREWPVLSPVALRMLGEDEIEVAERTGWLVALKLQETRLPLDALPGDGPSRLWRGYEPEIRWTDRAVPGWNDTFSGRPLGDAGWFLRRDRACLVIQGERLVEIRSDPLPYGLAAEQVAGEELPFLRLARLLAPMLPRTIRAVQDGLHGVWITTSYSLDLVDTSSWRIVERYAFPDVFREESWNRLAFLPPEGLLVHEVPREDRLPATTVFLRTPEDRRLLRHRFLRDPLDVLEGTLQPTTDTFFPGEDLPAPPFRGFALNARGDLVVGTRRGLFVLRADRRAFERFSPLPRRGMADIADVRTIPGTNDFAALVDGRPWRCDLDADAAHAMAERDDLIGLWSDGAEVLAGTNGRSLMNLEDGHATPWPCADTSPDREIRAFGRSGEEILVVDRENHLLHWTGDTWQEIPLGARVSSWSGISRASNGKLVLNLESSCWQLDSNSQAHFVLDYRQGLAAQVERNGLQNVMFFLFAIALSTFIFCSLAVLMLDKGPLPASPPLPVPPLLLHVLVLPLIYKFGILAGMGVTGQSQLAAYPVWASFFQTTTAAWFVIWLARRVLARRYEATFEHVGLMPIRFPVLLNQFLLGILAIIPLRFLVVGVTTLFAPDGEHSLALARAGSALVPHDPTERVVLFVTIAILPTLVDEILFRGLMQTFLVRRFGAATGIVLTAMFFTTLHELVVGPDEVLLATLPIFLLGLVLSSLRHVTGNLYACFGLHFAQNATTALVLALSS